MQYQVRKDEQELGGNAHDEIENWTMRVQYTQHRTMNSLEWVSVYSDISDILSAQPYSLYNGRTPDQNTEIQYDFLIEYGKLAQ